MLLGASGTGKELLARGLHDASARRKGAFVAINCAAIPETLLESELFGHEKGAFTGAHRAKPGLFELAAGGTLILDEIGEMSLPVQSKLLRAVQEREVRRIGGRAPIAVDAAIVFATNRDLRTEVEAGRFREDLYYRVNVVHLAIPPLRDRREDIAWLAQGFLAEQSRNLGGPRRSIDPPAMAAMTHMPWPGNVRELKHAIERACILSTSSLLHLDDVVQGEHPLATATATATDAAPAMHAEPPDYDLSGYLQDAERDFITRALHAHDRRITDTAKALGVSRKGLWEKMKRLGLKLHDG
jgi:transcriptional regulator with PAS, ATPase and Fis domain